MIRINFERFSRIVSLSKWFSIRRKIRKKLHFWDQDYFEYSIFSLAKMFLKSLSHFMIYLFYFYLHNSTNSLMGILRTNRRFDINARFSKHFYFIFQRIRIFCRFLITLSVWLCLETRFWITEPHKAAPSTKKSNTEE